MSSPTSPGFMTVRTSFTNLHDFQSDCTESSPNELTTSASEDSTTTVRPARFRRNSFALSGERVGTLDDLVESAKLQQTQCFVKNETDRLSNLKQSTNDTTPSGDTSHRPSTCTLMPISSTESSGTDTELPRPQQERPKAMRKHVSMFQPNVHDDSNHPLHSELIQHYLAALAVQNCCNPEPISPMTSRTRSEFGDDLPGMCNWAAKSVASMTMPVRQVRRAHVSTSAIPTIPTHVLEQLSMDMPNSCSVTSERHAPLTDTALSDSDPPFFACNPPGYLSDTASLDAAAETAKQLRLAGRRLEACRVSTGGNVPSGVVRTRRTKGGDGTATGSKISLVYHNPRSLSSCDEMAKTPASPSPVPQFTAASTKAPEVPKQAPASCEESRFRSLMSHFVPKDSTFDSNRYYSMDEKAKERRANAQASNVIAPVSF